MAKTEDPFRAVDDEARAQARALITEARYGALAVLEPGSGSPSVSRVGLVPGPDGVPMTLVSDLSPHTQAMRAHPEVSLLLGEAPGKGDPLAYPRITLQCRAGFVDKAPLAEHFLELYPKARLYFDFADFHLVRLNPHMALLNGGYGKAYKLTRKDII
ncbi:MAG: pyridoxamine 5'-phosphate oxidase family protein [Pseudomonadota bacterium]